MKRKTTDGVKTFENHLSNKKLVSRIYKVLSIFNTKKISLENGQIHEDIFYRGNIQMTDKHTKKCSTFSALRLKIKTTCK